ncbi:pilus assembly FimT family protein [Deinococcus sp.]|uniref:pilus assembly FimT family protein n=1 Tax=Deinococcus sp. TaxID=47478 RepID=UPI003CC5B39F
MPRSQVAPLRPSRRTSGFTLLELLIVIAIIGVLSGVLFYFSARAVYATQLRDGAIQVLTDLRQARSQAQRNTQGTTVTLDSTSTLAAPKSAYTTCWGTCPLTTLPVNRALGNLIRVAPYTSVNPASSISYKAPYGEVSAIGIVWEISSARIPTKFYVKTVGVTGKVVLSASPTN